MDVPEAWWVIGIVLLAAALGWGLWRQGRRRRSEQALSEAATRALYDNAGKAQPMAGDKPARPAEPPRS